MVWKCFHHSAKYACTTIVCMCMIFMYNFSVYLTTWYTKKRRRSVFFQSFFCWPLMFLSCCYCFSLSLSLPIWLSMLRFIFSLSFFPYPHKAIGNRNTQQQQEQQSNESSRLLVCTDKNEKKYIYKYESQNWSKNYH